MLKDVVENEIVKELNLRERILFRLQKNTFTKIYQAGVKRGFNFSEKNG